MANLSASIYTPRWGHDDKYEFELTKDSMTVTHGVRKSKCVWRDNKDPKWEGESLESHLRNDSIYPPAILPTLLEHLWKAWRNGELTDAQAQTELDAVTEWLNSVTKSKPKTSFWKAYF
jgi:hypothetical protein